MSKNILNGIGILALVASIAMKVMARGSHLTELKSYWWIPLPVALICFVASSASKKTG